MASLQTFKAQENLSHCHLPLTCCVNQAQLGEHRGLVPIDALRQQLRVEGQRKVCCWVHCALQLGQVAQAVPTMRHAGRPLCMHILQCHGSGSKAGQPAALTLLPSNLTTTINGTRTRLPVGAIPARFKGQKRSQRMCTLLARILRKPHARGERVLRWRCM